MNVVLVASWNDPRPMVKLSAHVVQLGEGQFELRYGPLDGRPNQDGAALVEVATSAGRKFAEQDGRHGTYYSLDGRGSVEVGDAEGLLYTTDVFTAAP